MIVLSTRMGERTPRAGAKEVPGGMPVVLIRERSRG